MVRSESLTAGEARPAPARGRRIFAWFRGEFLRVLPIFVFFFLSFNFINETTWLIAGGSPETHFSVVELAVAAGIVGKVVLVADYLPVMNAFADRPRIFNVVWKTAIYSLAVLAMRFLEHFLRFSIATGSFHDGYARFLQEIPPNIFWGAQLWYTALFLVYGTFREVTRIAGPERVRRELFGD
jgi:hypothetical protein